VAASLIVRSRCLAMSKFHTMALKVEDGSPSPFAYTSSVTLGDHPSTSPSNVYMSSPTLSRLKTCDYPVSVDKVRPSPVPSDDVKMGSQVKKHEMFTRCLPDAEDFIPTKSEPSASTPSTSPKPESTPPAQRKPLRKGPQLIGNPTAREEVMRTFIDTRKPISILDPEWRGIGTDL